MKTNSRQPPGPTSSKTWGDDVTGHLRRVFFFIFTTSTYLPAVRYYSLTASTYHFRLYRLTYNRPSGRYVGNMRMPTSDLHAVSLYAVLVWECTHEHNHTDVNEQEYCAHAWMVCPPCEASLPPLHPDNPPRTLPSVPAVHLPPRLSRDASRVEDERAQRRVLPVVARLAVVLGVDDVDACSTALHCNLYIANLNAPARVCSAPGASSAGIKHITLIFGARFRTSSLQTSGK